MCESAGEATTGARAKWLFGLATVAPFLNVGPSAGPSNGRAAPNNDKLRGA